MNIVNKLDFAGHEIEAKKLIKSASDFLMRKRFQEALEELDNAIIELRMMRTAVKSHVEE